MVDTPWSSVLLAAPVVLGGAAVWAYYRPRRSESRNYALGVTALLVLSVLVLAFPTYWSCPSTDGQSRFWTQLTFALNTIIGDYRECGTPTEPRYPLALQLARFLGPLAVVATAVGVVGRVFRAQIDRVRVRWARRLIVVVGLQEGGMPVLLELLGRRDEHTTVAVLVEGPADPVVERARLRGARVVVVNPQNGRRLQTLLCRGGRFRVRTVHALAADVATNLAWADRIRTAAASSRAVLGLAPRMIVRIDDPWQAEYWRRRSTFRRTEPGQQIAWASDSLSTYEVTASLVVRRVAGGGFDSIVLVGSSPLALAVCAELAQLDREARLLGTVPDPGLSRLVLVGPQAADLLTQHQLRQERFGNSAESQKIQVVPDEPTGGILRTLLQGQRRPAVILADSASPSSSTTATFLAASNAHWTIFDWSAATSGVAPEPVMERLYPFGLTIDAPSDVPMDGWERAARMLHERYLVDLGPKRGTQPSHRHWDEGLSTFLRDSNIRAVTTTISSAEQVGRTWGPTAAGNASETGPADGPNEAELEKMARLEHQSWLAHLRLVGWRFGAVKDDRDKVHPALREWTELDPDNREGARQQVRLALSTLEAIGYRPRPSTPYAQTAPTRQEHDQGWRVVTRRGEVSATRATKAWTWQNSQGGTMHGQAGDWQVVDDRGQQWSVSDDVFHRTYHFVAGDRWRRGGTVLARPAVAEEVVESLEGRQTAMESDWVIKGSKGEEWLTSAAHFAENYERVGA